MATPNEYLDSIIRTAERLKELLPSFTWPTMETRVASSNV